MNRRKFIVIAAGGVAWPLTQQAAKLYRVTLVFNASPVSEMVGPDPIHPAARGFVHGLRDLGYVEGRNLVLEHRSGEGKIERFPEIIRELLSVNVDVIVTANNTMTRAAKEVTQTVPIVMALSLNPVEQGLVQSLSRPGGNVTGLTSNPGPEFAGKRLQLLKELVPTMSHVAFLQAKGQAQEGVPSMQAAGRAMGIKLLVAEHTPSDYADAFALIARERPQAFVIPPTAPSWVNRQLIIEFEAKHRIPGIYPSREYVAAGGLMSYGISTVDMLRRSAGYVDKILKGAKPADLPVEQPTKFDLVINLKTSRALGVTIPPTLLTQVNEVIE